MPGHLAARLGCAKTKVATWDDLAFKLIILGYGYCKNLKKTVKTRQIRTRERKEYIIAGILDKALNLQFSSVSIEASGFKSMFRIPSSKINLLKVGSSRGLVKISTSFLLKWNERNSMSCFKQAYLQATDKALNLQFSSISTEASGFESMFSIPSSTINLLKVGSSRGLLEPEIVEGLIHFLDAHYELVQLFRTARDKCRELDILEFKIQLYNVEGARGYDLPTSNTLGAIVFVSGIANNVDFDVIIQHRDDTAQRVNKLHPSYMSLQFPLLFIYGQPGYHTELKLKSVDGVGERDGYEVRGRIILPMSFTSGPYTYDRYLDALAICRKLGNPQLFITFTCNVNWPKIKRFMSEYPHLTASDRANVVYRCFIQSNPRIDPEGYNVVSELMMHGPCGAVSSKASCMKGDKCSKNFPKKINQKTFFDENGHVHYRRRDTSISNIRNQFKLDNSYVVPYNRHLLLAFQAHINVEYYGWSMLIKYLFKYISKGTDKVFACASKPIGESSTGATPSPQVMCCRVGSII
ncbi:DNA helicase [Tanacetum coccineum]